MKEKGKIKQPLEYYPILLYNYIDNNNEAG